MEDCAADDEAHFPGESGCRSVGSACPDDGWPADLPGTGVWYVSPGSVGGDGTVATPFGTVAEALAAAADGDTIALGAGSYDEPLVVEQSVTIVGACARDTVLTSASGGEDEYVIVVQTSDVEIADLGISDGARGGILVDSGSATVRGVALSRLQQVGLRVGAAARLTVSDVTIRDLVQAGWLSAFEAATGILADGTLEASGVSVLGGSRGIFGCGRDSEVTDSVAIETSENGFRICGARPGHTSSFTRVVAERPNRMGFILLGRGPEEEIELADAVVHDHTSASGGGGIVITCFEDALDASLERVWVEGATSMGLEVHALNVCGVSVTAEDLVVEGVRRDGDGFGGVGVQVRDTVADLRSVQALGCETAGIVVNAGSMDATGAVVDGAGLAGLVALTEATAHWTDVAVFGAPPEVGEGYGLLVSSGSTAVASRVRVEQAWAVGILVENSDELGTTSFVGSDVVVAGTGVNVDGLKGFSLVVSGRDHNTSAELTSSILEGGADVGYLCQAATCTARDVRISNVASQPGDGLYGGAFEVHGADLTVERAVLTGVQGSAVALFDREGTPSSGNLQDIAVHGVEPMACAGDGRCPGLDAATGVYLESGVLDIARVLVEGARGAGLQCSAGDLTVSDAIVLDGAVGTNFQGCTTTLTRIDSSGAETPDSAEALPVPVP